ncbi:MAG: response regulator [Limnothrix sp. RL_2_0]|nr:response regulator [Limnothrix sp. RL_2_0]
MALSLPKYLQSRPLRTVLVIPFVAQIVGIVGIVGYLSFRNGQQAVNELSGQLRSEITTRIEERLKTYLTIPHQINRLNVDAVRLGQLDTANVPQLEQHFWQQIQQFPQATYIYFGSPQPLFSGAGIENGQVTLGYSTSSLPEQLFETYATDELGNRSELLSAVPGYRLLERPWYQAAIANRKTAWGEPYIWAAPYPNLALPALAAVYTPEFKGVFAVDFSLLDISEFLRHIKAGKTGKTFILDRDGLLVANGGETLPFLEIAGQPERIMGGDSEDPLIQATAQYLDQQFSDLKQITTPLNLQFKGLGDRQLVQVSPYKDEFGLDWLIVVVIPEADFMAQIYENARQTVVLCAIALGVALGIGMLTSRWVLQPISNLNTVAQALAEGQWQQDIHSDRPDELGDLTRAIAKMATQLQESFNTLEQRVEERTAALEESNQQLAQAKEKAEVANQAKSTFLTQMSHELRTPLNAMLGFTQIMRRSPNLDADQEENLEIMQCSGEHLLGLINHVLDLSKIEAGTMTLHQELTNLSMLFQDLGTLVAVQARHKHLDFQIDYPQDLPPTVLVDSQKLRQVLLNLLNNAVKFTEQGLVSLTVTRLAQQDDCLNIQVAIADTGVGIPPVEQAHLFQPFHQNLAGRTNNDGTGLGLVISQSFVQLMGSEISLKSIPGKGSTFSFPLNLTIQAPSLAPHNEPTFIPNPKKIPHKILIVDDSRVNRLLFQKLFAPHPFELAEACNGEEAIAQWQTWQPDLIFMDLLMPIMDGEQAIRTIRQHPNGHTVKIIACTASLQIEQKIRLQAAGCDDFLGKPFRTPDVFKLLKQYLDVPLQLENN